MILQSRPTLLLTRPLAQSQRFAAEVALRFGPVRCVISPLLVPKLQPCPPAPACAAVIFTSETGVAFAEHSGLWAQGLRPDTAYCVGTRTAKAAAAMGFRALDANGDWRDLAHLIAGQISNASLLFAAAAESPIHLEKTLQAGGFTVHRRDVYCQNPQPLTPDARALLHEAQPVVLPIFSPRSAQLFCDAGHTITAPIWLASLSAPIAAAFTAPFARRVIAQRPNSAALLDAMAEFLPTLPQLSPLT